MISLTRGETLTETTPILTHPHVIIACSPVCDRDASRLPKPGSLQLCPSNPRDPGFIPAQSTRESRASLRDSYHCYGCVCVTLHCVSRGTIASYVYCITVCPGLHVGAQGTIFGFFVWKARFLVYIWHTRGQALVDRVGQTCAGLDCRRPRWTGLGRVGQL